MHVYQAIMEHHELNHAYWHSSIIGGIAKTRNLCKLGIIPRNVRYNTPASIVEVAKMLPAYNVYRTDIPRMTWAAHLFKQMFTSNLKSHTVLCF